jgi:hypothetical protein
VTGGNAGSKARSTSPSKVHGPPSKTSFAASVGWWLYICLSSSSHKTKIIFTYLHGTAVKINWFMFFVSFEDEKLCVRVIIFIPHFLVFFHRSGTVNSCQSLLSFSLFLNWWKPGVSYAFLTGNSLKDLIADWDLREEEKHA